MAPIKPCVVWNPLCVPKSVNTYSPSWKKPREFMDFIGPLIKKNKVPVKEGHSVEFILRLVHDSDYINSVLAGATPNGFGTKQKDVAKSMLYTCGAMVEGIMLAHDGWSSCVPVSGFHHAGFDFGGGFCTFNGLALAAVVAQECGMRAGILDLDMHYGNGTVDILSKTRNDDMPHYTFGGTSFTTDNGSKGDAFVEMLPSILDNMFSKCTVLLYQAGADPHVDDPLGGALTTEQMKSRDEIVFSYAKSRNIPVVWNLAGGYQRPLSKVLKLHETTFNVWLDSLK